MHRLSVSRFPDIQTGVKYSIDVSAGTYTDVPVTFERPFASTPTCFCSLRTPSEFASYGSINPVPINASTNGFTIRFYNNSSNGAVPSINWLAIA